MPKISVASLGLLVLLSRSLRLPAQSGGFVFGGGGLAIPTGDFKNIDNAMTGWIVAGGGGVDLTKSVWIAAEGWYGSSKYSDAPGDKVNLAAGLAAVGYAFSPKAKGSVYVLGGGGFMNKKEIPATGGTSVSTTKVALSGAAGYRYTVSKGIHLWAEGRYLRQATSDGIAIIPITAGLSFALGKQ